MESNQVDPIQSLQDIADAQDAAATRLTTPIWYHPILGLLAACYLVAFALGSSKVHSVALIVFLAGTAALVQAYRRRTGVWISGFGAGKASGWAYALSVLFVASFATAKISHEVADLKWPTWVAAVVVVAGTIALGHLFDNAVRKQIRQGK
ncbi:MAG: hypothetical protein M3Q98_07700 [Actinomycetota bacterium]|nr:hypothetical protein [Actinomycetota bacterium]